MNETVTIAPAAPAAPADPDPTAVAIEHLIVTNMSLVGHIVRETMNRVPAHVGRDDLHSAGLIALVTAAKSFDAERGVPFARYAVNRIRGAILDELRGIDWASRAVRRRSRDLDATRSQLASLLGRTPENSEVARALGITLSEVENNDGDVARASVLSLHAGTETSYEELLVSPTPGPEDEAEHHERLEYLVAAIEELPERMRLVVQEYFLAERPMAEVAESLGVTESRISQIRAEALILLRDAMNTALDPALVVPHARPQGAAAKRRLAYFDAVAARHTGQRPRPAAVRLHEIA